MSEKILSEESGYYRCQCDTISIIKLYGDEINTQITILKRDIKRLQGLKRQEKISEFLKLCGEQEALTNLIKRISSVASLKKTTN